MATVVTQKKLKRIKDISFIETVIVRELGERDSAFLAEPPSTWTKGEKQIYDMLREQENRLKETIHNILNER